MRVLGAGVLLGRVLGWVLDERALGRILEVELVRVLGAGVLLVPELGWLRLLFLSFTAVFSFTTERDDRARVGWRVVLPN